jgi:sulfoxide reductase heme-binding subunit YedZ
MVKTGVLLPWKDTAVLTVLLLARVAYTLIKRFKRPTPSPKAVTTA